MNRLLAILVITLAGCVSSGGTVTQSNPAQAVYAAKEAYAVALTAAVAYKRLPPCVAGGSPVCRNASVLSQLQKADDAAAALIDGAQATVNAGGTNVEMAITAATQAVAAFGSITQTLKVK